MIKNHRFHTRNEGVQHYLYLFNHPNDLYLYPCLEWAWLKAEMDWAQPVVTCLHLKLIGLNPKLLHLENYLQSCIRLSFTFNTSWRGTEELCHNGSEDRKARLVVFPVLEKDVTANFFSCFKYVGIWTTVLFVLPDPGLSRSFRMLSHRLVRLIWLVLKLGVVVSCQAPFLLALFPVMLPLQLTTSVVLLPSFLSFRVGAAPCLAVSSPVKHLTQKHNRFSTTIV